MRVNNGFGNRLQVIADSLPHTSGSMLSAARWVLDHGGVASSPTSGFHHACYGGGGSFCTFNGLMVTALALKNEGKVQRVGILDCDYHYGNGTDDIILKTESSWVTNITNTKAYTSNADTFLSTLPKLVSQLKHCDIILYQAGADPHVNDPFGGFLTTDQMLQRDQIVFDMAKNLAIPLVWNLAGGYQLEPLPNGGSSIQKVIELHDNTMQACINAFIN